MQVLKTIIFQQTFQVLIMTKIHDYMIIIQQSITAAIF